MGYQLKFDFLFGEKCQAESIVYPYGKQYPASHKNPFSEI